MRVLIPVLHYWPVIGGLERWTQEIAQGVAENAEVFVVTGKVKNKSKQEVSNQVKITRTSLFSLANLSYSSFLYIITTLPFIFFKSLSVIKKEKINIIHSQGFLSAFLGYLLFKLTNTPYIVTVQRLEQSKSFLKRLVYKNAKVCIAASSKIKEYFESINCKDIIIIPNGIDLKRFENLNKQENREKLGLKNEFVIMTIARLEKVKGIKYLIKAVKSLDINYKLLIIGDGSERVSLENFSKELGLEKKIQFLGQIENSRIPEYLSAGDCFVLPSISEGFGIVVLEAMASRLPVIGTRVGGLLDLIENEKTGILVEAKNTEQIAGAVLKVYKQPDLARLLTNNALAGLNKYNWQIITDRVFKIYKELSL